MVMIRVNSFPSLHIYLLLTLFHQLEAVDLGRPDVAIGTTGYKNQTLSLV